MRFFCEWMLAMKRARDSGGEENRAMTESGDQVMR